MSQNLLPAAVVIGALRVDARAPCSRNQKYDTFLINGSFHPVQDKKFRKIPLSFEGALIGIFLVLFARLWIRRMFSFLWKSRGETIWLFCCHIKQHFELKVVNVILSSRDNPSPKWWWALKMGQWPIPHSNKCKFSFFNGPFEIFMGPLQNLMAQESLISTLEHNWHEI